jgi:hypothetical protein
MHQSDMTKLEFSSSFEVKRGTFAASGQSKLAKLAGVINIIVAPTNIYSVAETTEQECY